MKKYVIIVLCTLCAIAQLHAQPLLHPWYVIPPGGNTSSSSDLRLIATVGQPAITSGTSGTLLLEPGYASPLRYFTGAIATCKMTLNPGWNMVAVPLMLHDYAKTTLFPTATSPAYTFNNGYISKDTLACGGGYWLKFGGADPVEICGTACIVDTFDVMAGWNMVGALGYHILATDVSPIPPVSLLSPFHRFIPGTGYRPADTLEDGIGYWVRVSSAGKLAMHTGSATFPAGNPLLAIKPQRKQRSAWLADIEDENIHELAFTDATGNTRSLFVSAMPDASVRETMELPPPPPEGVMDVRFRSQYMLEIADGSHKSAEEFPVAVTSVELPLKIAWDFSSDPSDFALQLTFAGEGPETHPMKGAGALLVTHPGLVETKIIITPSAAPELPKVYALAQNYPNPFNPFTVINYQLPIRNSIALRIYNMLGQEVATLVDEIQDAGFKSVKWDASGFASGVYLYRMQSGTFLDTKKLVVLK